jgi:hypothetical protein
MLDLSIPTYQLLARQLPRVFPIVQIQPPIKPKKLRCRMLSEAVSPLIKPCKVRY